MTSDERAYELLKWQSLAPLGEFDPSFPYFDVWKAASDKALDEFERDSHYETSDQMKAFQYLERLGVYSQSDYYSPSKAKDDDHNYVAELKQHQQQIRGEATTPPRSVDQAGAARRARDPERKGQGPLTTNAEQGVRTWRRPRRQRPKS